ncbi:hypothetical protein Syun_018470 [Stephania yunnanensis]|uniref:Uncharacterized protein n=1 Tax=Stephania yunnanensis TaxID=152371 RepID=A0AAP0ISA2_9MAGN
MMSMCNKMHKMSHPCEHEGENQNELLVSCIALFFPLLRFYPTGFSLQGF